MQSARIHPKEGLTTCGFLWFCAEAKLVTTELNIPQNDKTLKHIGISNASLLFILFKR